ncbi:MAG: hypothetical protein SVM79_02795 [Chloroflexota bacterium]|nr:hypothetical protein [Chloroflexota bacterium]
MVNNNAGLFDLIYRTLVLQPGHSLEVPAYFPEDIELQEKLSINVHWKQSEIKLGNESHMVFVCDVPALNETHYVTEDGRLLQVRVTDPIGVVVNFETIEADKQAPLLPTHP